MGQPPEISFLYLQEHQQKKNFYIVYGVTNQTFQSKEQLQIQLLPVIKNPF